GLDRGQQELVAGDRAAPAAAVEQVERDAVARDRADVELGERDLDRAQRLAGVIAQRQRHLAEVDALDAELAGGRVVVGLALALAGSQPIEAAAQPVEGQLLDREREREQPGGVDVDHQPIDEHLEARAGVLVTPASARERELVQLDPAEDEAALGVAVADVEILAIVGRTERERDDLLEQQQVGDQQRRAEKDQAPQQPAPNRAPGVGDRLARRAAAHEDGEDRRRDPDRQLQYDQRPEDQRDDQELRVDAEQRVHEPARAPLTGTTSVTRPVDGSCYLQR